MDSDTQPQRCELPLEANQPAVEEFVQSCNGREKHCANSALLHLRRAWALRKVDPEIAAFRSLTAEEESATALILCLKRLRYADAKKVNHRSHPHKSAVHPFCIAIARVLDRTGANQLRPELHFDRKAMMLRTRVRTGSTDPNLRLAYPEPPLNFSMSSNGTPVDFAKEFEAMATDKNVKSMREHIDSEANRRNLVLYARDNGLPLVDVDIDQFILRQRDIVFLQLTILLLIAPHPQQQPFVTQAIPAFLSMLKRASS